MLTSPDKFTSFFNTKEPSAYQRINAQDVLSMKKCGLVGRYNYYCQDDLEIIRGILQYEQMREYG
ncbi:hypothetical protein ACFLT8_01385 [Chloroflexota bacterium]